jgi:CheY-like chemotaxis protein
VLLAEDNPINRKVATAMLTNLGCRVDVAVDGREAVQMFLRNSYHAIFMDCQMPELDGYEATRLIRSETDSPRTPIIAMTANALVGDRERCLETGMDDYIPKPLRMREVSAAVEKWLVQAVRV